MSTDQLLTVLCYTQSTFLTEAQDRLHSIHQCRQRSGTSSKLCNSIRIAEFFLKKTVLTLFSCDFKLFYFVRLFLLLR